MLKTKTTMHSTYLLQMQIESFWQGWHKTSKKALFSLWSLKQNKFQKYKKKKAKKDVIRTSSFYGIRW